MTIYYYITHQPQGVLLSQRFKVLTRPILSPTPFLRIYASGELDQIRRLIITVIITYKIL